MSPAAERSAVAALLACVAATRGALAFVHPDSLIENGIYQDDAFYYLQIARNAAAGRGFAFDESGPTSGFQPLYQLLLVPVVAVAGPGPFAAVKASMLMLAAWAVATGAMVFSLGRALGGTGAGLAALAVYVASPYFTVFGMNGQETGLAMFFGLALTRASLALVAGHAPGRGAWLGMGALAGLAVLARLDLALLVAGLAAGAWLRAGRGIRPAQVRRALAAGAGAALLTWLPSGAWNRWATESWLPLSGPASREIALNLGWFEMDRVWSDPSSPPVFDPRDPPASYHADVATKLVLVALAELPLLSPLRAGVPFHPAADLRSYAPYRLFRAAPVPALLVGLGVLGGIGFFLARRRIAGASSAGLGLALYGALLALGYTFYAPVYWHFPRYLAPALLLFTVAGVAAAARTLAGRRRAAVTLGLAALLAVPLGQLAFFGRLSFARDTPACTYRARFESLRAGLPPTARLGAFQAGVYSWFSGGAVQNLDGKVSTPAYRALAGGQLHDYVRDAGITHVIDWELMLRRLCLRHAPPGGLQLTRLEAGGHAFEASLYRVERP